MSSWRSTRAPPRQGVGVGAAATASISHYVPAPPPPPLQGAHVPLLTELTMGTADDILVCLQKGERRRRTGSTAMNARSSRSHALFRLTVESHGRAGAAGGGTAGAGTAGSGSAPGKLRFGTLNLVDLAGSEGVRNTGAEGARLKEGAAINKSLLTLSRVIRDLSAAAKAPAAAAAAGTAAGAGNGSTHISFRESKLTRVLQSSIAGNTRLAIVCCINPAAAYVDDSRNTLLFGLAAKSLKLEARVNESTDASLVSKEAARVRDNSLE